jgi:sulfide:quinone oxidoreductase
MSPAKTTVLIAGGGIAALEAAIALRELAPDLVDVELLSPDESFSYRPLAVTLPFDGGDPVRLDLAEIARELGASLVHGALTGIEAWRHVAYTSTNHEVAYDVLLIACGAFPVPAIPGSVPFRGPTDVALVRQLLEEIDRGEVRSAAFVVPWGPAWPLPAYELALLAGARVERQVDLWLVTPEMEPLQLFGQEASDAVRELLSSRGVGLREGAVAARFADGQLEFVSSEPLDVDRVVSLPRLAGAPLDGIPQSLDGFVPVDDHGRVHGLDDVYAAGDITSFPVKHGGLATQQALAAAEMIAAGAGADIDPQPFRPVVQGLLLTGSEPRFLRRELHSGAEQEPTVTSEPLWWPPAKIVGRHLAPFLAAHAGAGGVAEPPEGALAVEVPLERETIRELDPVRLFVTDESPDDEEAELGELTSIAVCIVAPEDTLGEIAEGMLRDEVSAVLVAEYGKLIGIVTTHDLMTAFAARAQPSEARARQWMTAEPVTLDAQSSRAAAARVMRAYGIHHLPLLAENRPVEVLHLAPESRVAVPIGLGF